MRNRIRQVWADIAVIQHEVKNVHTSFKTRNIHLETIDRKSVEENLKSEVDDVKSRS